MYCDASQYIGGTEVVRVETTIPPPLSTPPVRPLARTCELVQQPGQCHDGRADHVRCGAHLSECEGRNRVCVWTQIGKGGGPNR